MEWLLHQWEWYRQNVEYTDLGRAVVWIGLCHALRYMVKVNPIFDHYREQAEHTQSSGSPSASLAEETDEYEEHQPVFDNTLGRWLLWLGIARDGLL
jgi:hypothetical protein